MSYHLQPGRRVVLDIERTPADKPRVSRVMVSHGEFEGHSYGYVDVLGTNADGATYVRGGVILRLAELAPVGRALLRLADKMEERS